MEAGKKAREISRGLGVSEAALGVEVEVGRPGSEQAAPGLLLVRGG